MIDSKNITVEGFVKIIDKKSKEILIDKKNQINFENMSLALARSLANRDNGPIFRMAFGNGGSSVDSLGVITYLEPNVIGQNATLYNQTFQKIIDDNSSLNNDPAQNRMAVEHEDTKFYSDLVATCTLDFGEPAGQEAFDTASNFEQSFVFDELGLKTNDDLLISHIVFHPVQKSLNRIIEIIYTLRISIA